MTNRSSFELENIGSLYENGKKFWESGKKGERKMAAEFKE